jgi:hypothetical protein
MGGMEAISNIPTGRQVSKKQKAESRKQKANNMTCSDQ